MRLVMFAIVRPLNAVKSGITKYKPNEKDVGTAKYNNIIAALPNKLKRSTE
jgi:hypothetical protein